MILLDAVDRVDILLAWTAGVIAVALVLAVFLAPLGMLMTVVLTRLARAHPTLDSWMPGSNAEEPSQRVWIIAAGITFAVSTVLALLLIVSSG